MKKLSILALIIAFAAFAFAAEHEDKMNDQIKEMTVEEINQLQDGDCVKLEGALQEHEEENIYLYKDDTGEIKVEIAPEVWEEENLQFNPDQEYEIKGTAAKENDTIHVKADKVEEVTGRQDEEKRPDDPEGFLF